MSRDETTAERISFLEERIVYLEEANSTFVSILDMLASSDDFQNELNRGRTVESIFQTTMAQVKRLIPFEGMAFMENLEDASFSLALAEPPSCREELEAEINTAIKDGTFSWALNRNQTVLVPAAGGRDTMLLHVIATQERIRGMFIGILSGARKAIDSPSLNALSITLRTAGHALESCTLYAILREHLGNLEQTVRERTAELERTALELKKSNEKLVTLSDTDPLTQLYNRRSLMSKLEEGIKFAQQREGCISIIIVDIDHFKAINDTYGHQNGDVAIVAVGATTHREMRSRDIVARYGGEEFLIVLYDTPMGQAMLVAERLRVAIQGIRLPAPMERVTITASLGVATLPSPLVRDISSLIRQADEALYLAKRTGRNRVQTMAAVYPEEAAS